MVRPSKLTKEIQQRIGDNITFGLTYSLAASAAGITYKTFNDWLDRGKTEKSGKYYQFYQYIQKCNAEGAKKLLENLNAAVKGGDTRICLWISNVASVKISAEGYIVKQILFQKTIMRMLI